MSVNSDHSAGRTVLSSLNSVSNLMTVDVVRMQNPNKHLITSFMLLVLPFWSPSGRGKRRQPQTASILFERMPVVSGGKGMKHTVNFSRSSVGGEQKTGSSVGVEQNTELHSVGAVWV